MMLTQLADGFGLVTAGMLMLFGLYATVSTRGAAFRFFPAVFRQLRRGEPSDRTVSPFRVFATSLAGTIGVGNMTGVGIAVALGGAGAVFWMWISAFLCMTVKYFEIYLALRVQPREETHYGIAPMVYVRNGLESKGYAALFAFFGICSALTMGSMIQTKAAADAARDAINLPQPLLPLIFAGCLGVFLTGGLRRITGALERILPFLGGAFLLIGVLVIALRGGAVIPAFRRIFTEAFSVRSASGGFVGSGVALAFRHGVGNGLFSHEAGLGSAGLAHGACGADPKTQGLWGIFEVFFDTIVVSTVSALMILTTDTEDPLAAAEAVLGPVGKGLVALCLILFAFLALLSWSCYGETCFVWLCGKSSAKVFRWLYLLSPVAVLVASETTLWASAEILNGSMMILNLTALTAYREDLKSVRHLKL